ncbi:hypothetical protein BVY03_05060, partial [bacterium K02(2017)]
GEDAPVVENTSDANRALNRRTLFTFTKPAQLFERQTKRGTVGINTVTGKRNDSYTEVLKEIKTRKAYGDDTNLNKTVIKKYKDSSSVTVDESGEAQVKDKPYAQPKKVNVKSKSKKYYEKKDVTDGGTKIIRDSDIQEEDVFEDF